VEMVSKIDFESSQGLFNQYQNTLLPNQCYNNVFEIISKERNKKLKVAIGYMNNGLFYMRHAYLLSEEGSVIDPSMFFAFGGNKKTEMFEGFEYHHLAVLERTEYIHLLMKNNGKPNLKKVLSKEEKNFAKHAIENKLIIIEDDYNEYLKKYDKENKIFCIPNLLERLKTSS